MTKRQSGLDSDCQITSSDITTERPEWIGNSSNYVKYRNVSSDETKILTKRQSGLQSALRHNLVASLPSPAMTSSLRNVKAHR